MASTFISLPSLATNGPVDVVINAANDSIRISDGTDTLAVNPDGSINVVASSSANPNEYDYAEVTSVAVSGTATIISHVFAVESKLQRINCSGDNRAQYTVFFDAVETDKKRSSLTDFNCDFDYNDGLIVLASTTVSVEVLNAGTTIGDFNALLIYAPT